MSTYRGTAVYRLGVGTFTTSSSSYVDLLDNAGGSTITMSFTKSAGTSLLVTGAVAFFASGANTTCFMAVNDGTTDWPLGASRTLTTSSRRGFVDGAVLITGLGAGSYTLKARVRTAGAGTINFGTAEGASMSVIEVGTGFANANCTTAFPSSNFSFTSSTNIDLLDATAGSAITVGLTKASGSSKILVHANATGIASTTAGNPVLAVNDGTSDTDVGREVTTSNGYGNWLGEVLLTGLSAGAYTFKLRVRVPSGVNIGFNANASSATVWVMEIP